MKKVFKYIVVAALAVVLCLSVMLAGCTASTFGISSIELTSQTETTDTYTIYFTDGSSVSFDVTNGTNGSDGSDGNDGADGADGEDGDDTLTVEELYALYKSYYGDELTYAQFLEKYLSVETDSSSSINKCLLSVAKVYTEFDYTYSSHYGYGGISTGSAIAPYTGSAILYQKTTNYCYFVTNYHVVYDTTYANGLADRIYLYLYGSESEPTFTYSNSGSYVTAVTYDDYAIECEYIGGSAASDIAVIRAETADVEAINSEVTAVSLADGYYVGETAIAIGNAEGEGISVTQGIVSVDSEYITLSVDGTSRSYRSMRIDTAVYSGNSGGGLFNKYGQLIGIVNAASSSDENINYAIPLSIVKGTVDNILYYYHDNNNDTTDSYTISLGMSCDTENSKYVYDSVNGYGYITEDIFLTVVNSGSIAEGLELNTGDYLTQFIVENAEGEKTTYDLIRSYNIDDILLTLRAGYTISFTYTRGETQYTTDTYQITSSDLVERD